MLTTARSPSVTRTDSAHPPLRAVHLAPLAQVVQIVMPTVRYTSLSMSTSTWHAALSRITQRTTAYAVVYSAASVRAPGGGDGV